MLFLDDVSTGFGSIRPGSTNVDVNSSTGQNWLCRSVSMPKLNLSKRPFLGMFAKNLPRVVIGIVQSSQISLCHGGV